MDTEMIVITIYQSMNVHSCLESQRVWMYIHVSYALCNENKIMCSDSKTNGLICHAPLTAFYNDVVKLY